ncbi:MAG: DUF4249 family protein [Bacteroidetes bacterium]|nr:DUF4249 family protein [Bacteroidota bacterium]
MKNYIYLFLSIIILGATACQKVITVNLNDSNPQYVIEAKMLEGVNDFTVIVSRTTNYFDANYAPPLVKNATVTLEDNTGIPKTLIFDTNGYYILPKYNALNEVTYQLTVQVDGKTFKASSYLPRHLDIDSVTQLKRPGKGGPPGQTQGEFFVLAHFKDSVGVKNYYQIFGLTPKDLLKKPPKPRTTLIDDKLTDGNEISRPISGSHDSGDTLYVSMQSMDAKVFDYLTTLSAVSGQNNNNTAAPQNPNTNFTGGCLGYFGTFTKTTIRYILK